eukprot:8011969-Karenia_brevis.AAC.1
MNWGHQQPQQQYQGWGYSPYGKGSSKGGKGGYNNQYGRRPQQPQMATPFSSISNTFRSVMGELREFGEMAKVGQALANQ